MQREEGSVKVKKAVASLCALLGALGLHSLPGPDTLRRAKFNRSDAAPDMWRLLYSTMCKALRWTCACPEPQEADQGAQMTQVRNMLLQWGCGAQWLYGDLKQIEKVGSRDLLLVLGWMLSSRNLLEILLVEAIRRLETISLLPTVPVITLRNENRKIIVGAGEHPAPSPQEWERALRRLQWQHGKLTFCGRSLLAAQQERGGLIHQILSTHRCSGSLKHTASNAISARAASALNKGLERLQEESHVLERYLHWKHLETLFWCWMDSVIEARQAKPPSPLPSIEAKSMGMDGGCCRPDSDGKTVKQLREELQTQQAILRVLRVEQSRNQVPLRTRNVLDCSEIANIQERAEKRLQTLTEAYTPTAPATYRIHRQEQARPLRSDQTEELQGSHVIRELREKETALLQELRTMRQGIREHILEKANGLEGVVLIPPQGVHSSKTVLSKLTEN